ncbi:hypothetical protein V5098_26855 [Vibrio coralliirubri]|uniref:hypothetical protein n=1 Tax=Vibrio coralliirubri TaxID=1516159 RepID=UPI002FD6E8D4
MIKQFMLILVSLTLVTNVYANTDYRATSKSVIVQSDVSGIAFYYNIIPKTLVVSVLVPSDMCAEGEEVLFFNYQPLKTTSTCGATVEQQLWKSFRVTSKEGNAYAYDVLSRTRETTLSIKYPIKAILRTGSIDYNSESFERFENYSWRLNKDPL